MSIDLFPTCIGISSTALSWFVSYLSDRKQRVVLTNGDLSLYKPCESGVPQGSVLGPLLYSIYAKDVDHVTNPSHTQMFADDILIDVSSNTVDALSRPLSLSVTSLALYLQKKGLILNPGKTQVTGIHSSRRSPIELTVNYNGTALVQTDTAKYLGLWLDDRLRWDRHVSNIVRNTSQKLKTLLYIYIYKQALG